MTLTPETVSRLRELMAAQKWSGDWTHNIVPSGRPAHELACEAIRALPALLDRIEEQSALLAAMPTILTDPSGKGYPCVERPMTPAECKAVMERDAARIEDLERRGGEVDYEVWQKDAFGDGDAMVAGSTSLADAQHYAAVYSQDGPAWVVEVTRRPLPAPPALAGREAE